MARWAPEEDDTMAAIAAEFVAQAGTNRAVVAVDGTPGADLEHVAAALVGGYAAHGVTAMAAAAPSADPEVLRSDVVGPFRSTGAGDGVLVVHGRGLLGAGTRTLWRATVWAETDDDEGHGDTAGKTAATAVLDVTDPAHPRRNWNDAC